MFYLLNEGRDRPLSYKYANVYKLPNVVHYTIPIFLMALTPLYILYFFSFAKLLYHYLISVLPFFATFFGG